MAKNPQTVIKEIPHKFTDKETIANQKRIISILNDKDNLDSAKETYLAGYKSEMKALDERLKKARDIDRAGQEMRSYKCNVIRDRDTAMVQYADVVTGNIVAEEPFTTEDWAIVTAPVQGDLFEDEDGTDGPPEEEKVLYRPSNDEPELKPNVDENGQVVAGADTDAYNKANPESPYQHLSEHVDFEPAIPSYQADELANEQPTTEAGSEPTDAANVDISDLGLSGMGIAGSSEEASAPADDQTEAADGPSTDDNAPEGDAGDGEADGEAGGDDTPKPAPGPKPKPRPAKRRGDGKDGKNQ